MISNVPVNSSLTHRVLDSADLQLSEDFLGLLWWVYSSMAQQSGHILIEIFPDTLRWGNRIGVNIQMHRRGLEPRPFLSLVCPCPFGVQVLTGVQPCGLCVRFSDLLAWGVAGTLTQLR